MSSPMKRICPSSSSFFADEGAQDVAVIPAAVIVSPAAPVPTVLMKLRLFYFIDIYFKYYFVLPWCSLCSPLCPLWLDMFLFLTTKSTKYTLRAQRSVFQLFLYIYNTCCLQCVYGFGRQFPVIIKATLSYNVI